MAEHLRRSQADPADGRREPVTEIGTTRVFLLDDHEMIRRGVAEVINTQTDMIVVGEAGSATEAMKALEFADPDVAVLDISLGDGNGIDVCRQITEQFPDVSCLMLTSVIDDRALIEAADAGAAGFCVKDVRLSDLVESIRKVAGGARLLDPVEIRMAKHRLDKRGDGRVEALTVQERKIFDLIGRGFSNRQVASEMFLAEKTVKNYVSNMFAKLGVSSRTEAAALAARMDERESNWRT